MAKSRPGGVDRRRCRRWSFGGCVFDEANWTLSVDGKRVAIETKPLEVLRELVVRAGNVVSKNELLDAIWPDVTVVEASLPTAIHKLRLALGDDRCERCMIETVPAIGYRFAMAVEVEDMAAVPGTPHAAGAPGDAGIGRQWKDKTAGVAVVGALAVASLAIAFALSPPGNAPAAKTSRTYSQRDQVTALRKLDVDAVEKMVAAGWDPNVAYDKQGDGAIIMALNICEWDPDHDQRKLLLMVRTLLEAGAKLDRRNAFGDTPYSVAKAKRFCGPGHPVTKMLRAVCYNGDDNTLGDRCLASYELKRKNRKRRAPASNS